MLGSWISISISSWIDPLSARQCSSPSFVMGFKSVSSDASVAAPAS